MSEDIYSLPRPLSTEPIHVQAMRGELDADTCAACGEPIRLHYDVTGCLPIGCDGAIKRRRLGVTDTRTSILQYGGDAHPRVSARIQWALEVACGPEMATFMAAIGHSMRRDIARIVAEHAVTASLSEDDGQS